MTKAKVQLYGQNRVVTIETDATKGAVVGENLYLRDGTLVTESMLFPQQQSNNPPITYWRLIQEIPPNIVKIAALTGMGYAFRETDGDWLLRRSGRAVINFAYGDATPLQLYVPNENGVVALVRVDIDTAFDGAGAALTVGTLADPDAFMAAADIDPAVVAGWEAIPDAAIVAGTAILLTITPGAGATAGAGRVLIDLIPLQES